MTKIAVDVILLPSERIMDKAIEANRILSKHCPDKIILNKENCLPHISLAMGCIDESKIGEIEKILNSIAKQKKLGKLRAIGIDVHEMGNGEKVSVFKIEKPPALQALHVEVISKTSPYFSNEVKADMLVNPSEVNDSTLYWIKNYPDNSGFEKFYPHITIGYGEISDLTFPVELTASKLALCHLGNECTCRKILASVNL